MPKVKVKELSKEAFSIYGDYADMLNPQGYSFGEEPVLFYRDMLQQSLGCSTNVHFLFVLCISGRHYRLF